MNLPSVFRRKSAEPLRSFSRLQNELDRLFENFADVDQNGLNSNFAPSCELNEDKTNYIIKFDIPGVNKDDVKIELNENYLAVTAERREEKKSDDHRNRFSEISYGSYQRSFTLPSAVDEENVDAKFENGVLTVTIPKTEMSKAKQIEIH